MALDWRFDVEPTQRFSVVSAVPGREALRASREPDHVQLALVCDYSRGKLLKAFRRRPWWRVSTEECPKKGLQWGDYESIDWERVLGGQIRASSYCVRKGLSRKAQFYLHCRKFGAKRPAALINKRLPETLVLDLWDAFDDNFSVMGQAFAVRMPLRKRLEFALTEPRETMAAAPGALWIVKPSVTNKGAEIRVVGSYEELFGHIWEWQDQREWVLQRYLAEPLLFQGRKFHLRAYVLATGALEVYFFNRVLLLASQREYDASSYGDGVAHITNTALQEQQSAFDEERCVHILEHLRDELLRQGWGDEAAVDAGLAKLWGELHQLTAEIFEAMNGEVSVFNPLPHCFELYGLDFLVTKDLDAIPLEANPGPDFRATGALLSGVVDALFDNVIDVAAERDPILRNVEDMGGVPSKSLTRVLRKLDSRASAGVSMRLT